MLKKAMLGKARILNAQHGASPHTAVNANPGGESFIIDRRLKKVNILE